jgi:hypothetical protein
MSRFCYTLLSATILLAASPVHAYVDPGTGSLAVQFLIGGAVAAAFMIKTYYYDLKRRIFKLIGREIEDIPAPVQPSSDVSVGADDGTPKSE